MKNKLLVLLYSSIILTSLTSCPNTPPPPKPLPPSSPTLTPSPTSSPTPILTPPPTSTPSPTLTQSPIPTPSHMLTSTDITVISTVTPIPSPPTPTPTSIVNYGSQVTEIEWVSIPAGEFIMGVSDNDEYKFNNEKPQHKIYLDTYSISKYEITQSQYKKFIDATGHSAPVCNKWDPIKYASYPVVCVTWNDANDFAKWVGGRLPTEAEWEKAARGTDGRIYPWGNTPKPTCNYSVIWDGSEYGCGTNFAMPVGSKPNGASPYGVMDMIGNVSEWVNDWYSDKYYANSPTNNPQGPEIGIYKVFRGGCWYNNCPEFTLRTNYRGYGLPTDTNISIGFRIAK